MMPSKVYAKLQKKTFYGYDIRHETQFNKLHIIGSKNIKLSNINDKILSHKKWDKIILIGEQERSCASIASWARANGYKKIFIMGDGIANVNPQFTNKHKK